MEGFSKLSRSEKIACIAKISGNHEVALRELLNSFLHPVSRQQMFFEELSENSLSNFFLPFGVAPHFVINGKPYTVPMVTEESSVVAAAANGAKFWSSRGGFKARVERTVKVGQVHFFWHGSSSVLTKLFNQWKESMIKGVKALTAGMEKRGGGLKHLRLLDKTSRLPGYYQLYGEFETCDAMGANFMNSVLESLGKDWAERIRQCDQLSAREKEIEITMCILSNYTPDCLVQAWVDCPIEEIEEAGEGFAQKFKRAVDIAQVDVHRAATHNKGIFNGVDGVILATGNDFRAVEANGHAYAALGADRDRSDTGNRRGGESEGYRGLSFCELREGRFIFSLTLPLALGTVGGMTALHPLAKFSLELLQRPSARKFMEIVASVGLAQNFSALRSLVTTGIQQGHMKMHLLNILQALEANDREKKQVKAAFENQVVTFSRVRECLEALRRSH